MKKTSIYIATLFILTFSLFSCQKEEIKVSDNQNTNQPKFENGRLVFKNSDSFFAFTKELNKKNDAELMQLEKNLGHHSLFTKLQVQDSEETDESTFADFNFPRSLQFVINQAGEYQVGDEIFWYNNGIKHVITQANESKLAEIKKNPKLSEKYFQVKSTVQQVTPSASGRLNIGANNLDARHQREFWQYSCLEAAGRQGWRKYVHEIVTYTEYYGGTGYFSSIDLRIKLEWKGRRYWEPASETREIGFILNGSVTHYNGLSTNTFPISLTSSVDSNNQYYYIDFTSIPLFRRSGDVYVNLLYNRGGLYTGISWAVELNGIIYHHVVNDIPSNGWVNNGYPLW